MATQEIHRYFLTDEDANNFYLELCEKYDKVEWLYQHHGETTMCGWRVE